jgi:2-keto-3-deoxy-L-rhamnonate aldolase RhmA
MTAGAQDPAAGLAFKQRLAARLPSLVVNVDHPAASLVEFVGRLGIDAVFFDCEQGSPDIESVEHMARAARLAGVASLVRLWSRDAWMIERMLLRGIDGIVVPRVDDEATARAVVETVRYVLPAAHSRTSVIVQIESREALHALDGMLSVEGIDAYFVGPVDLSKSLGHGGRIDGPEMAETIRATLARIAGAGRAAGMLVDEATVAAFAAAGVSLLYCHANDFLRIGAGFFRASMGAPPTLGAQQG